MTLLIKETLISSISPLLLLHFFFSSSSSIGTLKNKLINSMRECPEKGKIKSRYIHLLTIFLIFNQIGGGENDWKQQGRIWRVLRDR